MFVNTVILAGNLTRDPDFKVVGDSSVAEFSLAVNRKYKAPDGTLKEEVDFFSILAWGRLSELCRDYMRKGSACLVEGRLKQVRWESEDGKKNSKTKVQAERIQFIGKKPEGGE